MYVVTQIRNGVTLVSSIHDEPGTAIDEAQRLRKEAPDTFPRIQFVSRYYTGDEVRVMSPEKEKLLELGYIQEDDGRLFTELEVSMRAKRVRRE